MSLYGNVGDYSPGERAQLRQILELLKRSRRTVRLAHRLVARENGHLHPRGFGARGAADHVAATHHKRRRVITGRRVTRR